MPRLFRAALAFASLALLAPPGLALDQTTFSAAVELFNQRKPLEAQKAFEALAASDPKHADVQLYLGRLALRRNDAGKAVEFLEKAVALAPANSLAHKFLGDAYGSAAQKASIFSQPGLAKKCRVEYEKAIELDPKNIDARFSLMGFYQQAPSLMGGGMDKAHGQAEEIRKLDANRGRSAVAGLYVAEKKFDLAFAEYEGVLKERPDDYAARFQFGRLAAISGQRLDEGLAALRQCLTLAPPENQPSHAAAHWRIGNILEKKSDKAGARAAYEASLKVDPQFPQAIESLKNLK